MTGISRRDGQFSGPSVQSTSTEQSTVPRNRACRLFTRKSNRRNYRQTKDSDAQKRVYHISNIWVSCWSIMLLYDIQTIMYGYVWVIRVHSCSSAVLISITYHGMPFARGGSLKTTKHHSKCS